MAQMIGTVTALLTGKLTKEERNGKPFYTGYYKEVTDYQVWLDVTGLQGDFQGDTEHHGGVDKAILGYAMKSYQMWEETFDMELGCGSFGENLCFGGMDESTVCIGDIYAIDNLEVEVSQPRQPCWKINHALENGEMLKNVLATGRTGWYMRVLKEGYLQKGMMVKLLDRPNPDWSVARANEVMKHKSERTEEVAALLALPQLAEAWKKDLF